MKERGWKERAEETVYLAGFCSVDYVVLRSSPTYVLFRRDGK